MTHPLTGVFDLGTGQSYPIKDITNHIGLTPKEKIGDKHERIDNQADITKLTEIGWKPSINIFEYFNELNMANNA
jgi:hypothetical protein